jgi:hypothetical protein
MVTILYGTVEYYERQIADYLDRNQTNTLDEELRMIFLELEKEIFCDNFPHNEKIRLQFLKNLTIAVEQIKGKLQFSRGKE